MSLSVWIAVDTSGARRKFDLLTDSWKDLTPVLSELSKFKQAKIAHLFATGGDGKWPQKSARTEQRHASATAAGIERAPATLRRKLEREHIRAQRKLNRLDERGITTRTNKRGRVVNVRQGAINAVARRAFVRSEFERHLAGGEVKSFDADTPQEEKTAGKLGERLARAYGRAEKKPLGNLGRTIQANIRNGLLVIDSSWESPAPRALQEGATVGRGAVIEPHPFLFWEDEDAEFFKQALLTRGLLAASH